MGKKGERARSELHDGGGADEIDTHTAAAAPRKNKRKKKEVNVNKEEEQSIIGEGESSADQVGRCKLDTGLKAPCFQIFNLLSRNLLST